MRNTTPIIMAIFCLSIANSRAQESEPLSRTIFKLSPQHFINNSLKAGVERFNRNHSGSIAIFVTGMLQNEENTFGGNSYNGLAGELQFRKYVSPMKAYTTKNNKVYHRGIYGSAYLQGGSYSGQFTGQYSTFDPNTGRPVTQWSYHYNENIGNWGLGFTIGYQRTLWQVLFLEAFVGGGIQFSDRIVSGQTPDPTYFDYTGITDPGYKGILPKFGIQIGIGL